MTERPVARRSLAVATGLAVIAAIGGTVVYLGGSVGSTSATTVLGQKSGGSTPGANPGGNPSANPSGTPGGAGLASGLAAGPGSASGPGSGPGLEQPAGPVLGSALSVVAPPAGAGSVAGSPVGQNPAATRPAAPPAARPPALGALPAGRRGFLNLIGRSPSSAELAAIPARYGVVVLNQWDSAAARQLKQRDPSVVVLMYQCLSSTRSADDPTHRSGGVLYRSAPASWFATDASGNRVAWDPYPGHWQMAVWDAAYRQAWTDDVVADAVAGGWDGVLADNDMSTLSWYTGTLLSGAGSRAQTDARLRDGLQQLIDQAGPALNAKGKLLVPNISDGRLFAGRWAAHSRYGGGMEENFAHFGTSTTADWVGDWGSQGWLAQTDEMRSPGLSLAVTRASGGDHRTQLYGYASMLVRSDADAFWMPSTESGGGYGSLPSIDEMSWPLGAAVGQPVQTSAGAWTRQYAGAWVAVNPTASAVTLTPPTGARAADGSAAGPVRLDAYTGALLRMA